MLSVDISPLFYCLNGKHAAAVSPHQVVVAFHLFQNSPSNVKEVLARSTNALKSRPAIFGNRASKKNVPLLTLAMK